MINTDKSESAVLGLMLLRSQYVEMGLANLQESDFKANNNKILFRAINALHSQDKEISPISVTAYLQKHGLESKCTEHHVWNVTDLPVMYDFNEYVKILKQAHQQQDLYTILMKKLHEVDSPNDKEMGEIREELIGLLETMNEREHYANEVQAVGITEVFKETIHQLNHPEEYLNRTPTGYRDLDAVIEGLSCGSLTFIGARPSVGKTALGVNIACNIATNQRTQYPVLVFSMEMSRVDLALRIMSRYEHKSRHAIERQKIADANMLVMCDKFLNKDKGIDKLFFVDTSKTRLTPNTIVSVCRDMQKKFGGLSLILIDYMQMLEPDKELANRNAELTIASRRMKTLAMNLNCPVLIMSQLSRDVEKRSGNEVFFKNSDLRDSGALEQDADTIMFLDRQIGCSESVLYVTKNRGGKVGVVRLNFEQDYTTFTDVRFRDSKETAWNENESASERNQ